MCLLFCDAGDETLGGGGGEGDGMGEGEGEGGRDGERERRERREREGGHLPYLQLYETSDTLRRDLIKGIFFLL